MVVASSSFTVLESECCELKASQDQELISSVVCKTDSLQFCCFGCMCSRNPWKVMGNGRVLQCYNVKSQQSEEV